MVSSVSLPFRLARPLARALTRFAPTAFSLAGDILLRPESMPPCRFNSAVSAHRVFDTRRFMLAEFKAIRGLEPGATVNDAVLAVCGGALRRYLAEKGELPEGSLTVMAPFLIRDADVAGGGKPDMSWLHVQLGTHIADPAQRLAFIHEQTASSDTVSRAVGARELTDIGQHAPAATLALTSKMLGRAALGIGRRAPLANCTVTNVPGPSVPLYLCGARMTYFSAIMPITDGMGLVFAVTSYDGRIVISPTSCRDLMPDPEVFAQCVRDSFQEYLAAAERPHRPAPRPKRRAPVKRRAQAASGLPEQTTGQPLAP
jgi:WS/DGAT/MGAT family acyltransferase